MKELVAKDYAVDVEIVTKEKAINTFSERDEPYKLEIIKEIPENETIKLYHHEEYTDMCRGPHVPNTCHLRHFKMTKIKNTSSSVQPTSLAIHFLSPCACFYRASLKTLSRKLLLQSIAKHNQTINSPLSWSKWNLARSPISLMIQLMQYTVCLQALRKPANVSRRCLWTSSGPRLSTTCSLTANLSRRL